MPRKTQLTTARQPGPASKAEVFEELIRKVLGVNVKLEAEKIDKSRKKDRSAKSEDSGS
jgi:hypothetical protein